MKSTRIIRVGRAIFIPLPREMWKPAPPCKCQYCKGADAWYDTLAVPAESASPNGSPEYTWMVHAPEYQPG